LLKREALPDGDDAHERDAAGGRRTLWTRIVGVYERSLDWVLGHQRLTIAVAAASVALTVALYAIIPKGLLPEQDTGLIAGVIQADQNVAFAQMQQRTRAVAEALRKQEGVAGVA
ncbi:efflux RND transporter permease subunit, partial [Lysobacter sp. 2RAB21]